MFEHKIDLKDTPMTLAGKPLEAITEADLKSLVENGVSEDKTREYKRSLPRGSDDEKKEFLADVSSFANSAGGDLIYGIAEESGTPTELTGLDLGDTDAVIMRLENLIQNGISPRIPGISVRAVSLEEGSKQVVIIRVPRSFAIPHVVDYGKRWRFYSRNSAGKYPLDVSEVRAAFESSGTTAERVRAFRADRLAAIVSGQTPVLLDDSAAKIALHLVPLGAFDPAARYDVRVLAAERGLLQPIYRGGRRRYNFDGILDYGEHPQSTPKEPLTTGYVQVFRNGIIEYADSDFLRSREGELVIPSIAFEQHLLDAVVRGFLIQEKLGIDPPIFVMLSLLGVSGYRLSYSAHLYREDEVTLIDRADLIVLEVLAERFPPQPPEVQRLMKPAFDAVWNAAGYEGSRNYDEEGNWSSRRM